ncbi:MAG: polysaccharide deacetylase family protein [Firmicutes bacterium]|nr:polysaccharide deacetylase family protein [Bacillota bacterium]
MKNKYLFIFLLVVGILIGIALPGAIDGLRRHFYGAAPGVRVEGYAVGGLLPEEVMTVLEEVAKKVERPPENAYYDPDQGRVVPEVVGKKLNRQKTLELVMAAGQNEQVSAVLEPVHPQVTHSFFQPVFRGDLSRKAMALMINVAWGNEYIPQMLRILEEYQVKATFFFIGRWVERFPSLFNQIVEAGHEIANHGYYHGETNKMSEAELTQLILQGKEALEKAGAQPAMLFAPPAGEYDNRLLRIAASLGYRTILWTLDTVDWKRPAPEVIVGRVVLKAQNGALVLMHPTEPTVAALPRIIQGLTEKGFTLTTVSDLIGGP